jgi:hypothetical protein
LRRVDAVERAAERAGVRLRLARRRIVEYLAVRKLAKQAKAHPHLTGVAKDYGLTELAPICEGAPPLPDRPLQ